MIADSERAEFAGFGPATQGCIVRALDFGLPRGNPLADWCGDGWDLPLLMARMEIYLVIPELREQLLDSGIPDERFGRWPLIRRCARFDLAQAEMADLAAFRFLYERLFGPPLRPWITNLFVHAITEPGFTPEDRQSALATVTPFDLAPWEDDEPCTFFPGVMDCRPTPPPSAARR
jgi:hypothetical protein